MKVIISIESRETQSNKSKGGMKNGISLMARNALPSGHRRPKLGFVHCIQVTKLYRDIHDRRRIAQIDERQLLK